VIAGSPGHIQDDWRVTQHFTVNLGIRYDVHASLEISPDPKDDPFCLCSEEGNADFIVTLNPKDFPQERLRAKVISPEAMA